jgi:hypothetical protein
MQKCFFIILTLSQLESILYKVIGLWYIDVKGEVKWSEVKWSEVKWSEVKWSEVKWSEVKWTSDFNVMVTGFPSTYCNSLTDWIDTYFSDIIQPGFSGHDTAPLAY